MRTPSAGMRRFRSFIGATVRPVIPAGGRGTGERCAAIDFRAAGITDGVPEAAAIYPRRGESPRNASDFPMNDRAPVTAETAPRRAAWLDLLRDGRAAYTVLVLLGVVLHALQILVIAIIMPTVVADIGGAPYYTWAAMSYTIGSIVGTASIGPLWRALGQRRGYVVGGAALLLGTTACAVAPAMGALIAARTVQGFAGGLVAGGGMALISALFGDALRRRVLAMYQGTWMVAQLLGPLVGGVFAEIGWWRGSFWVLVPITLCFTALAWVKLPEGRGAAGPRGGAGPFPVLRMFMLAGGVFAVALAGPVGDTTLRLVLVAAAVGLVWLTFRLDRAAENRLYPSDAFSMRAPVGLALWIMCLVGMVQTGVTIFLPLLLQVVHGVTPLFVSVVTIAISFGWTVGTFSVSGWTGAKERFALWIGPLLMIAGLAGMTVTAQMPVLILLGVAAFVQGVGIGTHNVHIIARTMAHARKGEENVTASALPSARSLGTAIGAALSGMIASIAGLGDATDPAAVGDAITVVYGCALLPLGFAAWFMFRLVALGKRAEEARRAAAA